jgi:hypothetical protein
MRLQRTSFQAVIVTDEQLPAAIEFYRQAFDMDGSATSPIGAKLTGARRLRRGRSGPGMKGCHPCPRSTQASRADRHRGRQGSV